MTTRIDDFERFAAAWDRLRGAINKVECALPRQMSEAITVLLSARADMDNLIRSVGLGIAKAQGIAARSDETRSGSAEGKSPVAKPCAQPTDPTEY